MASCTINISDTDRALMESCAESYGMSVDEFVRMCIENRLKKEMGAVKV